MRNSEINELDTYLRTRNDYEIYEELIGESDSEDSEYYVELFDPLEFFKIYRAQISFIEQNKERPLFISQQLKALNLSREQSHYLYLNLVFYFDDFIEDDDQIYIC